ncbi:rhodanese-like domain-containing protein [Nocardioides pacificus]
MSETTPEIDVDQLAARLHEGTVVDVRERFEYVVGHVPGALPIPMGQLAGRMGDLPREKPVFVICASGNRSKAMTDLLRASGFEAWSVAGGTNDWARSGRPIEGGQA